MLELEYSLKDWDYTSDTQRQQFNSYKELNMYVEINPMDIILLSIEHIEDIDW